MTEEMRHCDLHQYYYPANETCAHCSSFLVGQKHDKGKQQWLALPLEILEPLADVMAFGEKKYGLRNCLNPFEDSSRRFFDAQMRHTVASQANPLAKDSETECYHLASVAFSALMRLYHAQQELAKDANKKTEPS